jgi:hypothetical protein
VAISSNESWGNCFELPTERSVMANVIGVNFASHADMPPCTKGLYPEDQHQQVYTPMQCCDASAAALGTTRGRA